MSDSDLPAMAASVCLLLLLLAGLWRMLVTNARDRRLLDRRWLPQRPHPRHGRHDAKLGRARR